MSCTLIVCERVLLLPQPSVAVHVRVVLYAPAQAPGVVTSAKVSVKAEPQASVAVAVANTGVAGQLIVVGAGRAAITGAVMSITLMVCEAVEALPHPSVAVQVRVLEKAPAQAPGVVTSAKVIVAPEPHPSAAVGVANTGAAGQLIVLTAGGVLRMV
jgi:hypothetical protein